MGMRSNEKTVLVVVVALVVCSCVAGGLGMLWVHNLGSRRGSGSPYAGLPTKPPTFSNLGMQHIADLYFYKTDSSCWSANKWARVDLMNVMKAFSQKRMPSNPTYDDAVRLLKELMAAFMESATRELEKCPRDATITFPDDTLSGTTERQTIQQFLDQAEDSWRKIDAMDAATLRRLAPGLV